MLDQDLEESDHTERNNSIFKNSIFNFSFHLEKRKKRSGETISKEGTMTENVILKKKKVSH